LRDRPEGPAAVPPRRADRSGCRNAGLRRQTGGSFAASLGPATGDFRGAHDTSDLPRLALNSGSLGGPREMCSSPRVASRGASAPVLDGRRLQKLALAGAFGHRLGTTS
jgi:hypothetical protein